MVLREPPGIAARLPAGLVLREAGIARPPDGTNSLVAHSLASLTTVAPAVLAAHTVYFVTLVGEPNPCLRHGEQRRLVINRLDLLRQAKALHRRIA
jgi:hypothetical protein